MPVTFQSSCRAISQACTYHYASECETARWIDKDSGDGSWQEAYDCSKACEPDKTADKGAYCSIILVRHLSANQRASYLVILPRGNATGSLTLTTASISPARNMGKWFAL